MLSSFSSSNPVPTRLYWLSFYWPNFSFLIHERQSILKRQWAILSVDLFTSLTHAYQFFELKKCALLCTLVPYALPDLVPGRERRAVLLIQFTIVYCVLSSKNVKNENASKFTKRLPMSLSTRFCWNFWYQFVGKRIPCTSMPIRSLIVTTLWFTGFRRSVEFLFVHEVGKAAIAR